MCIEEKIIEKLRESAKIGAMQGETLRLDKAEQIIRRYLNSGSGAGDVKMCGALYRAKRKNWDKYSGKLSWVYGYPVIYPSGEVEIHVECSEMPDILNIIEIDSDTLSPYIGLNDKNGDKIFGNDIVGMYSKCRNEWDYGVVRYGEFNCSCCNGVFGWSFDGADIREYKLYEIRGNVFDTPELIPHYLEN